MAKPVPSAVVRKSTTIPSMVRTSSAPTSSILIPSSLFTTWSFGLSLSQTIFHLPGFLGAGISRIVALDPFFNLNNLDLSFSFAASVTVNMVSPSRARPCLLRNGCRATNRRETTTPAVTGQEHALHSICASREQRCLARCFLILRVPQKKFAGIEAHAGDPMFEAIRCELPRSGRKSVSSIIVIGYPPSREQVNSCSTRRSNKL